MKMDIRFEDILVSATTPTLAKHYFSAYTILYIFDTAYP